MVDLANLGASDVPLKEAVIKTPQVDQPFQRTEAEWSGRNRDQITRFGSDIAAGPAVLFEVPKSQTLWMTSAGFMAFDDSKIAAGGNASMFINDTSGTNVFQMFIFQLRQGSAENGNAAYPMPIEVKEGWTVNLLGSATFHAHGNFQGWLEPKAIT